MKKLIKIFSFLVVFIILPFTEISAVAEEEPPIIIDGNFEDWVGKPIIIDGEDPGNVPSKHNLTELSYISDDEYLYLRIKLEEKVDYQYDIQVVFYNGRKGETSPHYPSHLNFAVCLLQYLKYSLHPFLDS